MLRRIAGGVVGAITAMVVVSLVQASILLIWPSPEPFDAKDPKQLALQMAAMPVAAKLIVVIAWALGAFTGGLVAAAMARHRMPALVIGALLLIATVGNLASMPHPWWMWVFGILIPLPCATLGATLGTRRSRDAPSPSSSVR
jgi:hypothetical protein